MNSGLKPFLLTIARSSSSTAGFDSGASLLNAKKPVHVEENESRKKRMRGSTGLPSLEEMIRVDVYKKE